MPKKHLEDDFSHIPNVAYVSPLELKPNRVLIGLGVGAIVIALGTLGYLLVDKLFLGESATAVPNIEITKKPPTTKAATPSTQKAETADWKTYTNTKKGFSFKYPPDWPVINEQENRVLLNNVSELGGDTPSTRVSIYFDNDQSYKEDYERIKSYNFNDPKKVSSGFEDLMDTYIRLKDVEIDGFTTIRYKVDFGYKDLDVTDAYEVLINKNGVMFKIQILGGGFLVDSNEKVEILDQILSTFKFLD